MGVRTGNGTLTAELVETFDREGLLLIDFPGAPDLLDELNEEFEARFRDDFHPGREHKEGGVLYARDWKGGDYHWKRIMDAWRVSDTARAVALEPHMLSVLEELYGRAPLPFQTLNFPVGTQQPAHSDAMFFSSVPDGYMCGVWVALEDVDEDAGPLVYYPGSHKLPVPSNELMEETIGEHVDTSGLSTPEVRKERNRQYAAYCRHLIEVHGLEARHATVSKGQAVIWASNLLHGGSPQRDPSRTRRSQVTHYLFEGSRLRRPLWSEGDLTYWDYPAWVRDPVPHFSVETLRDTVADHVPAGSIVLVATRGAVHLLDLQHVEARPFPHDENGDYREPDDSEDAIACLEEMREAGAEFGVFPPAGMGLLQAMVPELQQVLETRYRPIFVDGSVCAIYDLR